MCDFLISGTFEVIDDNIKISVLKDVKEKQNLGFPVEEVDLVNTLTEWCYLKGRKREFPCWMNMHSSAPYVDLYKLRRTGTETKAVGYGVLPSEIIRTKKKKNRSYKSSWFNKVAELKLQVSRTDMWASLRGRQLCKERVTWMEIERSS